MLSNISHSIISRISREIYVNFNPKTAVVNAVISGAIMASVMMPVALTTVAHAAAASQSQATKI